MGRVPTRNKNLPIGMRARHRKSATYYYLDTGAKPRKEIPLGSDYPLAVRKWAELTVPGTSRPRLITFRHVAEQYMRDVLPAKKPRTQQDNLAEIEYLYKFFDDPPAALDDIEPINIRQYLNWRAKSTIQRRQARNADRVRKGLSPLAISGKEGQVRANREIALFSAIWNFARDLAGLTSKANPCAGIKKFAETGRDIYIDDEVYITVWAAAEEPLRDALDLAYLTGQRPADVLKLEHGDIWSGALSIKQNKGGKLLRIAIEGDLAVVIARAKQRGGRTQKLINNIDGEPMTKCMLRGAFDRARDAAVAARPDLENDIRKYQFRDLRAKAGTDKDENEGIEAAKDQLGHTTTTMTSHYVRHRKGKLVKPTR